MLCFHQGLEPRSWHSEGPAMRLVYLVIAGAPPTLLVVSHPPQLPAIAAKKPH